MGVQDVKSMEHIANTLGDHTPVRAKFGANGASRPSGEVSAPIGRADERLADAARRPFATRAIGGAGVDTRSQY